MDGGMEPAPFGQDPVGSGPDGRRRVRVKVCGITTPEDAATAEALGADAVGIVFAPSRRRVDVRTAVDIVSALGPGIAKVGVFRDQPVDEVAATVAAVGLTAVQLHGSEPPEVAERLSRLVSVVRAVAFEEATSPAALARYPAAAYLLDASVPGSGTRFDWDRAVAWRGHPRLVVAGGLSPDNVAEAIEALAPYAVDVSSGVESRPGVKDAALVADFISAARGGGEGQGTRPGPDRQG